MHKLNRSWSVPAWMRVTVFLCSFVFSVNSTVAEDLPSVMDLQRAYVESNGGRAKIESLKSLYARGEMTSVGEEPRSFKLFRKRPNQLRFQVEGDGWWSATVFDGESGFREYTLIDGTRKYLDLSADEISGLVAESSMDGPFYELRGKTEFTKVVGEVEIEGVPSYEVSIDEGSGSRFEALWLSVDGLHVVKLRNRPKLVDKTPVIEEVLLSDFENIDGVWIAKITRYIENGEETRSVSIDTARFNVGIFDSYFKRPDE